jgi:putative selenate reductase
MFNMSVGYDLKGIKSEKLDRFIEGLKDASGPPYGTSAEDGPMQIAKFENIEATMLTEFSEGSAARSRFRRCTDVRGGDRAYRDIPDNRKRVNTFVKMNPTILGYRLPRDDDHWGSDMFHSETSISGRTCSSKTPCQ